MLNGTQRWNHRGSILDWKFWDLIDPLGLKNERVLLAWILTESKWPDGTWEATHGFWKLLFSCSCLRRPTVGPRAQWECSFHSVGQTLPWFMVSKKPVSFVTVCCVLASESTWAAVISLNIITVIASIKNSAQLLFIGRGMNWPVNMGFAYCRPIWAKNGEQHHYYYYQYNTKLEA